MESILTSVKKFLGPSAEYDYFDPDIIVAINTALSNLTQIGVGPTEGFSIEDDTTTWVDFLGDAKNLHSVKTYINLSVRMDFDPPKESAVIAAFEKRIKELEWRLNVAAEENKQSE